MKIVTSPQKMQRMSAKTRLEGKLIGLVPTMGFLHEGHLSLVDIAHKETDIVIISVFVNQSQFGPNEDFERYPRNFRRDAEFCRKRGVNIMFYPDLNTMYSPGHSICVNETNLSKSFCGASRPNHFRGVLTVVAKLFNIVQPDKAVFGQKDAQQVQLIKLMTTDLNFPVRILRAPIVREPDGLAMSSRNTYLNSEERKDALCIVRALKLAKTLYNQGERTTDKIISRIAALIKQVSSAKVDYIEIVDYQTFERVQQMDNQIIVLLAVWIGTTRLIDNLVLPDSQLSNMPD